MPPIKRVPCEWNLTVKTNLFNIPEKSLNSVTYRSTSASNSNWAHLQFQKKWGCHKRWQTIEYLIFVHIRTQLWLIFHLNQLLKCSYKIHKSICCFNNGFHAFCRSSGRCKKYLCITKVRIRHGECMIAAYLSWFTTHRSSAIQKVNCKKTKAHNQKVPFFNYHSTKRNFFMKTSRHRQNNDEVKVLV